MAAGHLAFECFPQHTLTLMLFRNVNNSSVLRDLIVSGKLEPEAAIMNATRVVDTFVVHVAAQRALSSLHGAGTTTKTLHSELVYNVGASRGIRDSLEAFGIHADTHDLLVARFDASPEDVLALTQVVEGTPTCLSQLTDLADVPWLHKHYKIKPPELTVGSLSEAVASRVSLLGFTK